ncbi:MAG: PepSY-like domain-containing protein [Acholeplasmataceae bacterium]
MSTTGLPQAILDYIQANYPNVSVDEIDMEYGLYEVELVNDLQ